jgi:hypothetical protein
MLQHAMTNSCGYLPAVALLVTTFVLTSNAGADDGPRHSEAAVKSLLKRCVDKQHVAPGIAVGLIDGNRKFVVAYGEKLAERATKSMVTRSLRSARSPKSSPR